MSWRLAKSLGALRDQVDAMSPHRDKSSDGTIGDARHAATRSEHNPDANGVVRALDITHDPAHGVSGRAIAELLVASRDPRIFYVISNGEINNSQVAPWTWRPYHGVNAHEHHVHISVVADPARYDDTRPWAIGGVAARAPAQPATGAQFRSLVPGGYFSSTPFDTSIPTSIRTNNPGALNVAPWVKAYSGYVGDKVTSFSGASANSTVIFAAPEYGVGAWWQLMANYRAAGAITVAKIISRYGGGQDYSQYVGFVAKQTGLSPSYEIKLDGDDANLTKFAKAMFRYEAGRPTPLSDAQIAYGFALGRNHGRPLAPPPAAPKPGLLAAIAGWFTRKET